MVSKKYTPIETWLWEHLSPDESDSARQTYDSMLLQGGGKLPVINLPLDLRDPAHFADEALIQEFAAQIKDAGEVLDVGCGDGWPSLRVAPFCTSVTGIDASARRIDVSRANAERLGIANVKFVQMSAVELNFAEGSFDAVVAASAIEQTPEPIRALESIFKVLRPGGRLSVKFESFEVSLSAPLVESVALREHPDGSLGWHYCLKHRDPPWERDYLVKFSSTPEMAAAFNHAREVLSQVGDNPVQAREIGLDFLEANQATIQGSSYYELEHFTTKSMMETLEDVGFTDVKTCYSAGKLARMVFPHLNVSAMAEPQLAEMCQALAQLALNLPAPLDQGQPVIAAKPLPA